MTETQLNTNSKPATTPPPPEETMPAALRRPVPANLGRMLTGRPFEEEIIDPANPNLLSERD